jgi:archaellin
MTKITRPSILLILTLIIIVIIPLTAVSLVNTATPNIRLFDYEHFVDDIIDDITSYIQIKNAMGKYQNIEGSQQINQIALLIQPLLTTNIDMTTLTIQLTNNQNVKYLTFNGEAQNINNHLLFSHPLWKQINQNTYGTVAILDEDQSLTSHNTINKDLTYLLIQLPEEFYLKKGETITLTLYPSTGQQKTITLKAPMPMTEIITFE